MNKLYKAALLAALGLGTGMAAQAQTIANNDLVLGFTSPDATSISGVQYDYIIDLGQLLGQSAEQVTLSANQYNDSTFTSDLGSAVAAGGAYAGIFGATPGSIGDVFLSATSTPATGTGNDYKGAASAALSVNLGAVAQSGQSIYNNISSAPGDQGNTVNSFAEYVPSPLENITSGEGTGSSVLDLEVYEATFAPDGIKPPAGSSFTDEGYVSVLFGSDGDIQGVAWDEVATPAVVPEPSTIGIFAGAGLLLLGLHRKLTGKKA